MGGMENYLKLTREQLWQLTLRGPSSRLPGEYFLAVFILLLIASLTGMSQEKTVDLQSHSGPASRNTGREIFIARCAGCHGTSGNGGEFAPGITNRILLRTDDELATLLHEGVPASGMPAFPDIDGDDRASLIGFLRTLRRDGPIQRAKVTLIDGARLDGMILNRSAEDMQLLDGTQRLHLLRSSGKHGFREVTSQMDWANYDGGTLGNRYSPAQQINVGNVKNLQARWIFQIKSAPRELQGTPVVAGGVMYVTTVNECYALDAGSGRLIWSYQRPRTKGVASVAGTGVNRGAAISGDRVFLQTDNAHLIALNRFTGALLWDTGMGDIQENYGGTAAPLIVRNMVVSGISGGDSGARGFVAAYDQTSGKEIWRFWTVPERGQTGAETWKGNAHEHPGGATWMTGEYDSELNTIYWPVGNPGPDLVGDERLGDNLYTDSIVALEPATGALKWYFQFTPHDLHDFDAMAPPAIVDLEWDGKRRKLLVQANRNGFLYVLDRENGRFLAGSVITRKLDWASGLDPEGHPISVPGKDPTYEGNLICPWLSGATNWYSTSWNPLTKLYYVQTEDKCGIYTRRDQGFESGRSLMGGSYRSDPADPGSRQLRAFDIRSGKIIWEIPQVGAADSWGGVLTTAGQLAFWGDDDYSFSAADAKTGRRLWSFQTNVMPRSSPMTYVFDHVQYVAVTAGSNVLAFALPETKINVAGSPTKRGGAVP
jgi:alcohol dehydrogenase (cytochrome c)